MTDTQTQAEFFNKIGALQPVADHVADGRRFPIPAVRNAPRIGSVEWGPHIRHLHRA